MHQPFTANDIHAILTHPVYTGMGPFQPIVAQDTWLDVNVRIIHQEGAPDTIRRVLARFQETFPDAPSLDPDPYIRLANHDPRAALRQLLDDLRRAAAAPLDFDGRPMTNQEILFHFYRTLARIIRKTTDEPANHD